MADDIDDLLDEVEESFSAIKKKNMCNDLKSASIKTDDLKDLLEDLEPPPPQPFLQPCSPPASAIFGRTPSSGRCSVAYLGGTALTKGLSQGTGLRACDRLRCLGCDLSVVSIDGFAWTPYTDYLFLRNNYPDVARLRARLDPHRGTRAYTCQCQCRTAFATTRVDGEKGLKWSCGGH